MQRVAYYYWIVLDHVHGKPRKTRFRASEAPAPGAIRLDDTVEWRELPEPGDKQSGQWPLIHAPESC
jgi:hypothetical protein